MRQLSVTKIASLLTSGFPDFDAEIKDMTKQLKAMGGKELTKEYQDLSKKIKEAEKGAINLKSSQQRGTAFHKIVELLEKGRIKLGEINEQKILELSEQFEEIKGGIGTKRVGKKGTYTDEEKDLKDLTKLIKNYDKFKRENKLSGTVTTEKSLGMITKIGDEYVEVVGTLDSLFNELGTLIDFKTSAMVDPKKIGIQLNLLKKMLKVGGVNVKSMKAFHLPFSKMSEGGVYDVREVSDEIIFD